MKKVVVYRKELEKYAVDRNELITELDKNGKLERPYLNVRGWIIPLNKIYSCSELKTEINFEKVKWELK